MFKMNIRISFWVTFVAFVVAGIGFARTASADITVGVSVTTTGPAAALGIPLRDTVELLPKSIDGIPVRFLVFNDGNFPQVAAKDAQRMVESNVDILFGGNTVPSVLAVASVAVKSKTPQIGWAPIPPKPELFDWVFPLPQPVGIMAAPLFAHMKHMGVRTLGFIGYSDGYGGAWLAFTKRLAAENGIKLTIVERFDRTDRSVLHQGRRILEANPDAVLVAASGTVGAMPMLHLRDRGYKGQFYQTHGVASNAFLRAAGAAGEGLVMPAGPVLVPEQLPASHPSREIGIKFQKLYEQKYGAESRNMFGGHAYDAWLLFERAAKIALKKAKPGTAAFRKAVRDALESTKDFPVTHGVINMSPKDHNGMDSRSAVLVTVKKGRWVLIPNP